MKPLPKPIAFAPRSGSWVNPAYLPTSLRNELRALVPAKLQGERLDRLLAACALWAQYVNENRHSVSIGDQVAQLERVASCARELQHAMGAMAPETATAFVVAADALTLVREASVHLTGAAVASRGRFDEGRFLGVAWNHVSDLEGIARHASSRAQPSKQTKVSTANARTLVYSLVRDYRDIFGALPPSSKGGWFVSFVGHLAAWDGLNLSCGPALVQAVFREAFSGGGSSIDDAI